LNTGLLARLDEVVHTWPLFRTGVSILKLGLQQRIIAAMRSEKPRSGALLRQSASWPCGHSLSARRQAGWSLGQGSRRGWRLQRKTTSAMSA